MAQLQEKHIKSVTQETPYFPFPVPDYRFDQRNEMFKRRTWDEKFIPHGTQFYTQVKYGEKYGYRKLDYALRNASWHIEYGYAMGILSSNRGMYSWDHISDKVQKFLDTGGMVSFSPEKNARIVKKPPVF